MKFTEVPTLSKFERHALSRPECHITQHCYEAVKKLIDPVEVSQKGVFMHETAALMNLKARCEALEKSTRMIWACAAATDYVTPRKWDYIPDYESALQYFDALSDLDLMAETKHHRIIWEQKIQF